MAVLSQSVVTCQIIFVKAVGVQGGAKRRQLDESKTKKCSLHFRQLWSWLDEIINYFLKEDNHKEKELVFEKLRCLVAYFYTLFGSCYFLLTRAKSQLRSFLGNELCIFNKLNICNACTMKCMLSCTHSREGESTPKSSGKALGNHPHVGTQKWYCPRERAQSWDHSQKSQCISGHVKTWNNHNP